MIKKTVFVTAIFIFSTFIQLLSQIIVTRIFGANLDLDIFLAAVALPTILVTVIYGTLNDAFLPFYVEKKNLDPENADNYFYSMLFVLGFGSFLIALVLNFLSEPITRLLYGGRELNYIKNVSLQMRFMFMSIPVSLIATLLGSYFYSHKHFLRFPVAQAVGSVTNVVIIVLLAPSMGIWALVIGFVINILFQIAFVIPKSITAFKFSFPNILPLIIAWIPLVIGSFALRSDTLLIRSFASDLPAGTLVYLNLITKIFSLATSIMTIGIQVLLLPHLVEYFSKKEYEKAISTINKTKLIAIGVSGVVTFVITLIAPIFIKLVFVGGKFTPQDADATIALLPFFVLPAIGWGVNSVFFQPLLALKKQIPLGIINVLALAIGWGGGLLIKNAFGPLPGIAGGLILLLFTGIIGSELLWQKYKQKLILESQ